MSYPNDEAEDRVIARALDAGEADEAAMDRAALDDYRNVLAHLPFEEVAPPAALERRVFDAALAIRPAAVPSIKGRAAKRRSTARWITLGAAVAAAAAVVTFMFTTSGDSGRVGGQMDLAGANVPFGQIVSEEGTRTAPLVGQGDRRLTHQIGRVALATDGDGAIYDLNLAAIQPGEVLWVWLVAGETRVPIGAITDPAAADSVGFKVTGDSSSVDGIAMSIETSGERPEAPGPVVASASF